MMPEREKVAEGLEHCSKGPIGCQTNCPYQRDFGCRAQLTADALALLKEQKTLLKKSYELLADMEMDFFCDDLMCDDGWCDEHCTTNGPMPECIERWLRKQISEGR